MAEPRRSLTGLIVLVVVVLVAAGLGGAFLYEYNHPKASAPLFTVAQGDNVTVNYIGVLGTGPETGRVFDTSLYSVATNNVTYPKSLEFTYRGNKSAYTPLPVYVGPSGSYTVDGLTFGTVVTGFWQGLIGLPIGKTQSISVPPDVGYGPVIPACLVTAPLTFTVPVVVSVPVAQFSTNYPGVNTTAGTEFTDPTYGWTDLILATNSTSVVVENLPSVGWSVPKTSWTVTVTNVNATTITLKNQLETTDAGLVLGKSPSTTVCGSNRFLVTQVNIANGTFTELYDSSSPAIPAELQGQTLDFEVTIVANY